ncbi:MAG: TonB family protein [Candidatus Competibacteraceae bacterium]
MRASGDFSGQGRLAWALLLALGLHTALLFGVSVDGWRSFQRPAPPQFEIRRALPEPVWMAAPTEPALMEWLPPAQPKPFLPKTTVLGSAHPPDLKPAIAKPAPPRPVIKSASKPPPEPVAKPALPKTVIKSASKPPPEPVAKPAPKPLLKPGSQSEPGAAHDPPPKLTAPATPVVRPKLTAPPGIRRLESAERRAIPAPGQLDSTALLDQVARLDIEQQRKKSAGVRVQRVSLTDTRSAAGFYAADWARKVMRVGEMNFPDVARRLNTSAGPLLEVVIQAGGRLQEVRVVRSSGHAELDQAARRIVELAAPYPPFSPDLRQQVDVLRIEAPWRFDPGGRVRAR